MDTDVIAAALLAETGRGEEAARLLAESRILLAPSHWKAELANVIWKATLLGRLSAEEVDSIISIADRLRITSVDVSDLWRGAVVRAVANSHPVYDTLFVELAVREKTRVASYDRGLQRRFPDLVFPPARILRSK